MTTEQEQFWKGEFGNSYAKRNYGMTPNNIAFFARALQRAGAINSVIEFGAGTGQNLEALSRLYSYPQEMIGVEINEQAAMQNKIGKILRMSALDYSPAEYGKADLVLTKGFLIHLPPDDLPDMYEVLYGSTRRYILVCEYYNPTPVEVDYRGHKNKLWKRDFAGDLMYRFPDLCLVDYGFVYHRGAFPQDDLTWFLLEK